MTQTIDTTLKEKINLETSQIAWSELQRFFAQGLAINVAPELDLVETAYQFSIDNKVLVAQWLASNQIGLVTDQQALAWLETEASVWAVVVKPWLLVQG
ncbi:MAG: DUF2288 domain-containing protein [Methylovulum sp.]|uniref:DUF2288 domain-containing protein n=1 Tax=Methylovulum sp. TaxID=1916980 RepID=UPI0026061851|nr:DUF2288 domain-containing protein [Methylovulum sp.]MDD2724297.1 DUF2288 domain-containing protein [Methylovulum sp.]MDD5122970.1 DUF2288 domain-containing protein [Methylovulum sp.]